MWIDLRKRIKRLLATNRPRLDGRYRESTTAKRTSRPKDEAT